MIVVRTVFQAKYGQAGGVVEGFKQVAAIAQQLFGDRVRWRLLTDLSGPFDTVVQEFEVESLAEWERIRAEMFASPLLRENQAFRTDLIEGGRSEYYALEAKG